MAVKDLPKAVVDAICAEGRGGGYESWAAAESFRIRR